MKIGLQTWGTDGDFMPFLALALGLKKAGHAVSLAYTSVDGKDYSNRTDIQGIELIKADGGIPIPKGINPYAATSKPGSFGEYSKLLQILFDPFTEAMYAASEKLCMENDLVIGHAACHTLLTASQKHGTPRVSLVLTPLVVPSKHVSPLGNNLGTSINSMMWWLGDVACTWLWFKKGKAIRKREGLPPIKSLKKELFVSDTLTIVAASEALVPPPKDWPSYVHMTGFLNLPSRPTDWQMPDELCKFLNDGEPPVYMTFGSCTQFDLEASTQLMVEAAQLSGKRTIIQSDWDGLDKPNDPNLFCIGRVPHSEVFPHCSMVVHHGGAGTTQAALLAGLPSVVVAHAFDQPYWGQQLENAGVAGKTLIRMTTTPQQLANAIRSVAGKATMAQKAKELGRKMETEDGTNKVIEIIKRAQLLHQ